MSKAAERQSKNKNRKDALQYSSQKVIGDLVRTISGELKGRKLDQRGSREQSEERNVLEWV